MIDRKELRSSISTGDALNVSRELVEAAESEEAVEVAESEEAAEGQPDMWSLFELDSNNGGPGKYSDRGAILRPLDADILEATKIWLEANSNRAIEHYGYNAWRFLVFTVGIELWSKQMPEEVRHTAVFLDKPKDGLPLHAVAVRTDGKKWDLSISIRAEILRRQRLSGRAIAEHLNIPESSLRDMKKRAEKLGFSLDKFTPYDIDAIRRGIEKRGRPKSS